MKQTLVFFSQPTAIPTPPTHTGFLYKPSMTSSGTWASGSQWIWTSFLGVFWKIQKIRWGKTMKFFSDFYFVINFNSFKTLISKIVGIWCVLSTLSLRLCSSRFCLGRLPCDLISGLHPEANPKTNQVVHTYFLLENSQQLFNMSTMSMSLWQTPPLKVVKTRI